MRRCSRGHEYRGDENYRARHGWCPHCFREAQDRYNHSAKGRARHVAYNHSDQGTDRTARYRQSPAGWLTALEGRRRKALQRRANRETYEEAEDSSPGTDIRATRISSGTGSGGGSPVSSTSKSPTSAKRP